MIKSYVLILLTMIIQVCAAPTYAQQYLQKQDTSIVNLLPNAGFENGLGQYTYTNSGTVLVTSGTAVIQDAGSLVFTPTGVSQTVSTKLYATKGLAGTNCEASMLYKTNESANPYVFRVVDVSSTILSSTTLTPSSSTATASAKFTCGTNVIQAQLISAASAPVSVTVDSMHLGSLKALTSATVTTGLGYTPLDRALNLSDLASATVARSNLGLGALSLLNTLDLGSGFASGTLAAARLPAFTGDVTSSVGSSTLTIANSGVVSGTYTKVTVNAKGIVTSGATLSDSDIPLLSTDKLASGTLPVGRGGTGQSSVVTGDLLVGSGTSLTKLSIGSAGFVLTSSGGTTVWASGTSGVTTVQNGGTGLSSYATGDMLYATSGATTMNKLNIGSPGYFLKSVASSPTWASLNTFENLLLNPDFEINATTDWLFIAGTLANLSYTVPSGDNLKYVQIGLSAGSSYSTTVKSVPTFAHAAQCEASALYNNASGSFRMEVLTSGSVVASQTLTASLNWTSTPKIIYACGTTTTQLRFVNLADGTMQLDNVYLGLTRRGVFSVPTVQKFTSGSGTYTTPANIKYIRVRMVGGGGGGGGSGTGTSGGTGGAGASTTFGTSLLVANGGGGGVHGGTSTGGGVGGNGTVSGNAINVSVITGGGGSYIGGAYNTATTYTSGGRGGGTAFGPDAGTANDPTNPGVGGRGGDSFATSIVNGNGGGGGGFVDAIIVSPSATYSYAVGSLGGGGAAGTSGVAGGNGVAGYIEVTEYY